MIEIVFLFFVKEQNEMRRLEMGYVEVVDGHIKFVFSCHLC